MCISTRENDMKIKTIRTNHDVMWSDLDIEGNKEYKAVEFDGGYLTASEFDGHKRMFISCNDIYSIDNYKQFQNEI